MKNAPLPISQFHQKFLANLDNRPPTVNDDGLARNVI